MQLNYINKLFENIKTYLNLDSYYFKPLELDKFQMKLEQIKNEINEIYGNRQNIVYGDTND